MVLVDGLAGPCMGGAWCWSMACVWVHGGDDVVGMYTHI